MLSVPSPYVHAARRSIVLIAAATLAAIVLGACTGAGTVPSGSRSPGASTSGSSPTFETSAAEQYCTSQGGMLVARAPTWNTNGDPSTWLTLGTPLTFCEFQSGEGDQATRISVDLVTLYAETPTLAGVAYLAKLPPVLPPQPSANPATYNCQEGLGGTSSFGDTAAGGGWVDRSQPVFVVMNECVFADMSAIDEFGILYYSQGTIRGADLATKMRWKPDGPLPPIFVPQGR